MKNGDRVKQTHNGMLGTIIELVAMPNGTNCAWVKFDKKRKQLLRMLAVLEPAEE